MRWKQNAFKQQQKLKILRNPVPRLTEPWTLTYISTCGRVWRPCVMYLTRYLSPFSSSLSPSSLPGIDFKVKTIDVDGKKVKLQVW